MHDTHSHSDHAHVRYKEARTVIIVAAVCNLVLSVSQIFGGYVGNSKALIADGFHTLSDLVTDFIVVLAAKQTSKAADEKHPYGHGRIETVGTVALATVLLLVAIFIGYDAAARLINQDFSVPSNFTLWLAVLTIFVKEAVYHYAMYYARKLRSKILEASAWHSRSDSFSSIIVAAGILGSMSGFPYLDTIAALLVALIILRIALKLISHSVSELIDTGLDADTVEKINATIKSINGVEDLHYLRTRSMGPDALVDVHILVSPDISVSEGHFIGETVRRKLIAEIVEVNDVTVHVDSENDLDEMALNIALPTRDKLLADLRERWQTIPAAKEIKKVTLHYLEGKINIDIELPLELFKMSEQHLTLADKLKTMCRERPEIGSVSVLFRA